MVQTLTPPKRSAAPPADPHADPLPGLLDALGGVADPRHARGILHPLPSILALCILAFICGRQSLSGVSRFGRDHRRLLKKLGFPRPKAPSVPTLSRVLGMVEPANLQRALALWLAQLIATLPCQRRPGEQAPAVISVDGKTSRAAGVHVLNVFLHDLELVLHQAPVESKQNEISAFKEALAGLLAAYPFLRLVVGDALFAGEPLCRLLTRNGRHYLFQVKADQPVLLEKLELLFAPQLHREMDHEAVAGEKKAGLCPWA